MTQARLLASPAFRRLFEAVHARLQRDPDPPSGATVSLSDPTPEERAALEGLLGRALNGARLSPRLADLDAALRLGPEGLDLRAWTERVVGPLRDRRAEAAAEQAAVSDALCAARSRPLAQEPWFQVWLDELSAGGQLTRLHREGALPRLAEAAAVLEALPVQDEPIALFASRVAGGTKALDETPLERLVLHALALRAQRPRPSSAEARRELWGLFGVVPDDLASQVLALGLRAVGDGPVDVMLRAASAAGLPVRLTLHQLVRYPPTLAPGPVFVCENPAVVRVAAERLGASCAPLIATEGRPSAAFWRLVACVRGELRVHADFDAAGLEIVAAVLGRCDARAWRFGVDDYLTGRGENVALPVELPGTPWDPGLREAMSGGVRVEEEQVIDALLADLRG